jgi:hypothetical protein
LICNAGHERCGRGAAGIGPTAEIARAFVTGFADRSALGGISETQIVSKPFVNDELARKVRVALAGGVSAKVVPVRP